MITKLGMLAVAAVAVTGCSAAQSQNAGSSGTTAAGTTTASSPAASSPATSTSAAPAGGSYQDQVIAWGRRLAQCAREHGITTFPDPTGVQTSGDGISLPDFGAAPKADIGRAEELCPDVSRDIPHPPPPGPPSAEILQRMRQYAACLRQNGLSAFPDPKADGTFPITGTPFAGMAAFSGGGPIPQNIAQAERPCRRFQVGWYTRAS
ncbi:MAG TPA: hypothetical protein VGR06_14995 [Actinophytocola sp.]|jgi:hypothetical protein|uniref:hypothetical protein n=1 Tax=Actinophytocola sp. TaxID=1872138 RepID=UPI002E09D151|nr:hypothetical protein [Actinophytocola sp.]